MTDPWATLYDQDATQEDTARALGYRTVDAMNEEHDPFHERLCIALGLSESPTLAAKRNGAPLNRDWVRCEEAMVLAAQRFINAWRYHR